MHDISFRLPSGETLKLSRDDAAELARQLWEIASEPGAAPLAVAINSALAGSLTLSSPIDLSDREHLALRRVLDSRPGD